MKQIFRFLWDFLSHPLFLIFVVLLITPALLLAYLNWAGAFDENLESLGELLEKVWNDKDLGMNNADKVTVISVTVVGLVVIYCGLFLAFQVITLAYILYWMHCRQMREIARIRESWPSKSRPQTDNERVGVAE